MSILTSGSSGGLDAATLAKIEAPIATIADVVVDYETGSVTGLKAVMATDTLRVHINNTGTDITLLGTTEASLIASGLELLTGYNPTRIVLQGNATLGILAPQNPNYNGITYTNADIGDLGILFSAAAVFPDGQELTFIVQDSTNIVQFGVPSGSTIVGETSIPAGAEVGSVYKAYQRTATEWVIKNVTDAGDALIPDWSASTQYKAGEPVMYRGSLHRSTATRTSSTLADAAEKVFWEPIYQMGATNLITPTVLGLYVAENNAVNYIDAAHSGTMNILLSATDALPDSTRVTFIVTDSTETVTFDAGAGTLQGTASIPAGTTVGSVYEAYLVDGTTNTWTVQPLGGDAVVPSRELLTIVNINTINNLPSVPSGPVHFVVNGKTVEQGRGISNTGVTVTVDPNALGYNIALTDEVVAVYPV